MRVPLNRLVLWWALLGSTASIAAPATPPELLVPPAGARHFVIESTAGKHGDSWYWADRDGQRGGRESLNLRGQVFELDLAGRAGADGWPVALTIRGVSPAGDAGETFSLDHGQAHWHSPVDQGQAEQVGRAFYVPYGGPMASTVWMVELLLAAPDHRIAILPGGAARAEELATLEVGGGAIPQQTVHLWSIVGLNNSPVAVWADAGGRFFALTNGLGWLPEAYAGEQQRLEEAQTAALARQTASIAHQFLASEPPALGFVDVQVFDVEGLRFVPHQTVLVDHGKITAVGPVASVTVPAQTRRIDGSGKTLLPGLWDCHMHVGDDYTGVQELSLGVTSVRDPGNNDVLTLDRRRRAAAGELLFPNVYASSLIDGKGPYSAQVANIASSEAEAIARVDEAKSKGLTGVKFYGTFNPAWLRPAIAEAHKLGLHVHGHIPAGIRPLDAVEAGYDEITHINWVIMQAMPDSVIQVSNGMARFEGPGRYAKDVDLDGPAMRALLDAMVRRHVVNDPTMVTFEGLYVPENGDLSPAYAPFVGTLPPSVERGFRGGGFAVPKDLTRADYRASWAQLVALLGRMRKAGIPIVAGTDGSGIEIVRELEIYQEAGFSAAEALAAATLIPARLNGVDASTGSIRVGKTADLVLVEGDPSLRLADLRQTRQVVLAGRLLDPDALRSAAGFSGRPH